MPRRIEKVPQIMQMEALECGAACLAMILAYYGRWIPLEQARVDCGVSRDGSKAVNILKAARRYGLAAKGMTFSTKGLRDNVPLPCILFWEFRHFVVLRGFRGRYAYINDPARGQVRIPLDEFDKSFTGVALVFEPTESFEKGGARPSVLKSLMGMLKGMNGPIAFVMATAALTSIVGILTTSVGKVFIDRILSGTNPEWLMPMIGILALLALISCIVSLLNAVYLRRIQGKVAVVSSSRFMRHLLHLPISFYSQRMVGDIQQRQSSSESIAFVLIGRMAPIFIDLAMLVFYLVVMLKFSPLLTLVGVSTVIINALLAHYISNKRINISRSMAMSNGKLYATTINGIEMIETIKASGAESGYFGRWAGYQAEVNEGQVRTTLVNEGLGRIPLVLTQLTNNAVLCIGLWLIIQQHFTAGALMAFQGFLANFMSPVSRLIDFGQIIQEMRTQVERIEDVMNYETDVPEEDPVETSDAGTLGSKLSGKIDLEDVSFGYSPLDEPLIEHFDLHLTPGKWVALVGSSGCGKSTITKIVSGLYKPWSGKVLFDDTPIEEIPRRVLRGSLSVVDQDIVTFDDSISDNVKLWDNSIEDYEVIMACYDADIHNVIINREGGYTSPILPGGSNFSGGQLQRIEIARVLAEDPTIVILDEATSSLDAMTEDKVIKRIRNRDITCIVVAHRLSTIRDCDEIIVLDAGKVVERGTHEELLALDGAYAKLMRSM